MTQNNDKQPSYNDDVKQSFAWGQLFAGSLIGGLAVWKLLHKMTNTEPSEWFRGLSVAYEEVRDFLMTPFQWIELDLTADEKNLIIVCLVLIGSFMRATIVSRMHFWLVVGLLGVFPAYIMGLPLPDAARALSTEGLPFGVRGGIFGVLTWVVAISLQIPLSVLFSRSEDEADAKMSALVLLNILFTVVCGTALLLLNWASS